MEKRAELDLSKFIGVIPDFPKPGILFRDITPLLAAPEAFGEAVRRMAEQAGGLKVDAVAAAEARGFLIAAPLALALGAALVPIRKPGKLPGKTVAHSYELEYGRDTLEIRADAFNTALASGRDAAHASDRCRVLVVDDLLATGGTVEACCRLVEKAGGEVAGCAFLIELAECRGAAKIERYGYFSLIRFE